jgi:membrane protein DedA with SNARE-associated domain/rhodanese-related sulfurtransferase
MRLKHTLDFLLQHGYAVLFVSVLIEQLGLPIPSIPILLAIGALAGRGDLSFALALITAVLACLIADNVWYWMGVYRGASILNLLCKISLEPDSCVRNTENVFVKYGPRGLLFAKFVPGLSTAACPLAGMFRMEMWKFNVFDGFGSLIWAGSYSALGYFFRNQLEDLAEKLLGMGSWLLVLVTTSVASWILWKYLARRRFYRELRISRIAPVELMKLIERGAPLTLVDVRSALEWTMAGAAKLPGALHVSFEELDEGLPKIPLDRDVVLYCTCPNEASSARAALKLKKRGVKRVRPLAGGFEAWRDNGYPLEEISSLRK